MLSPDAVYTQTFKRVISFKSSHSLYQNSLLFRQQVVSVICSTSIRDGIFACYRNISFTWRSPIRCCLHWKHKALKRQNKTSGALVSDGLCLQTTWNHSLLLPPATPLFTLATTSHVIVYACYHQPRPCLRLLPSARPLFTLATTSHAPVYACYHQPHPCLRFLKPATPRPVFTC